MLAYKIQNQLYNTRPVSLHCENSIAALTGHLLLEICSEENKSAM